MTADHQVKIGIKENVIQFSLLVIINLFVGSMVGLERTVLPIIGEEQFGLASASAALSFIVSFGFSKAIMNFFAGNIADHIGRKQVLVLGWVVGLFVPIFVIFAQSWWMIVFANVLLGVNQALTWSMTVNMKVDLAKSTQRGLAVGLNEFAGYVGVGLMAMISGYVAYTYAFRPEPFYLGIGIAVIGLLLSFFAKDTGIHLKAQAQQTKPAPAISMKEIFAQTTWRDMNLSSATVSGLTTNLKDGMIWGLLPIFLAASELSVDQIGIVVAIYPAAWGVFQLFTGGLSDRVGRKWMIVFGMWTQASGIWWILFSGTYISWIIGAVILGIGTAMVYPTLIAAISDVAAPEWRASSLGVYRSWRDSGYAFGAIIAGILADLMGVSWAIGLVGFLPLLAGISTAVRMEETLYVDHPGP